jgi:hypothetical protein
MKAALEAVGIAFVGSPTNRPGFALFCFVGRPNEVAVATRRERKSALEQKEDRPDM